VELLVLLCCVVALSTFISSKPKTSLVAGTIECDLCHFVVKEIDGWLAENQTEVFIINEVDKMCNTDLFKNHAKVCEAIVAYGVDELIAFVEESETPENACGPDQLNLCSSKILRKSRLA